MIAESDTGSLHAIVLAAGASTRFGSAKQLVRIGDRPLLSLIAGRTAEVVGHALLIVLGARAAELAPLLKHSPGSVVVNRDWRDGLASSIRAGIARLPPSCDGVMLVLADQACVTAEDLRRLAGAWRRQPLCVVAAQYGADVGAPSIFPRHLFGELSELRGDSGARMLLKRHADTLVRVPMTSAAFDLDTPDDLLELSKPQA
ncbi:MAG TPA: nucleotidyltransferase family protein [Steroidobacteraceae bacterium]|jgi:molybdenum cofactor cytidylyltransferase|nr:nucleotidyltransferase family protein [Steroidobacteraceae bacterium]